MSNYHKADRGAQWFANRWHGAKITPNCGVIHTTEGASWPSYNGGAYAPNYTGSPDIKNKRVLWRAHFPDEMSSRALENDRGGVETNTANAIQVELVGTCDDKHSVEWAGVGKAGVDYIYWPDAPDWCLQAVADFLTDMHDRHGIPIDGPDVWLRYGKDDRRPGVQPASYGASPARMSFSRWRKFKGWCGHQHVPENSHGDPGALDFARIVALAKGGAPSRDGGAQDVPWTPSEPKGDGGFKPLWTPTGKLNVREIQRIVGATVDGLYGSGTLAKVRDYQRDLGVTADGLWGKGTESAHFARERRAKRPRLRNLKRGSKGRRVRNLQAGLNRAFPAYSSLAVDGIFGRGTRGVVMEFQRRSGLTADGIVGKRTRKALARYGIKA